MKLLTISIILLIFPVVLLAQVRSDPTIKKAAEVSYPPEALKTGLEGVVSVKVDVDNTGKVTRAYDVTGPNWTCPDVNRPDVVAMRSVALKAAQAAIFSPAMVDGKAVESQTLVQFTFTDPSPQKIKEIVVGSTGGYRITGTPAPDSFKKEPESSLTTRNTKTISGGVLKGTGSVPAPQYPAAARAVKASGEVKVQVIVDTNGEIFSAETISGHPLLRYAARMAACKAKFPPTLLSGEPVKVSGIITYNFTP